MAPRIQIRQTVARTGETITIARLVQTGTGNPFEPTVTQSSAVSLKALVAPIDQRRIDGQAIQIGDLSCLLAAADAPDWIDTTTNVTHRDAVYKVASVSTWAAYGDDALKELILRR